MHPAIYRISSNLQSPGHSIPCPMSNSALDDSVRQELPTPNPFCTDEQTHFHRISIRISCTPNKIFTVPKHAFFVISCMLCILGILSPYHTQAERKHYDGSASHSNFFAVTTANHASSPRFAWQPSANLNI